MNVLKYITKKYSLEEMDLNELGVTLAKGSVITLGRKLLSLHLYVNICKTYISLR